MVKIFAFLLNYMIVLVNCLNLSKFLQSNIGSHFDNETLRDLTFYKFLVIILILVLVIFILQPEKLKYTSYFGGIALVVSIFYTWIQCFIGGFSNLPNTVLFDFRGFAPLIGSQLYSLESIASLFCVRSTMKRRSEASKMVVYVNSICGMMFILNGLFMYFSFFSPKNLSFFYFEHNTLMSVLTVAFYLTMPTVVIATLLSNLTMLEEIAAIKRLLLLNDSKVEMDTFKILIFRLSVAMIMLFFLFLGIIFYIIVD